MERTERLLDLVAFLLDSHEPVSWAELRDAFSEDYAHGSEDATERKFERDKAELLELGIPINYVQGDEDRKDGYVIERDAYYLKDPGFSREELAVLYAAGSAALSSGAFPGREDLAHALRKIGFFAGDALPTPRVRMDLGPQQKSAQVAEQLQLLWAAAAARKWVQLEYAAPRAGGEVSSRRVDPYGLALRRGIWSLVGFCHLRKAPRTFHVHRMLTAKVNPSKPRTPDFEPPADFDIDAYVAQFPWQHRMHPPTAVTLALNESCAPLADRIFPKSTVHVESGQTRVTVQATFLDGLLRYVLSLAPQATVVGPPEALARYRALAGAVLQRHRPAPSASSPSEGA